jgi:hypothetical protein
MSGLHRTKYTFGRLSLQNNRSPIFTISNIKEGWFNDLNFSDKAPPLNDSENENPVVYSTDERPLCGKTKDGFVSKADLHHHPLTGGSPTTQLATHPTPSCSSATSFPGASPNAA